MSVNPGSAKYPDAEASVADQGLSQSAFALYRTDPCKPPYSARETRNSIAAKLKRETLRHGFSRV